MLDADQERYIRIFYKVLNCSEAEIAKHYGVSTAVINKILHNTPKLVVPRTPIEKLRVLFKKWIAGASLGQIGREYKIDRRTLGSHLRWYGHTYEPEKYKQRKELDKQYAFPN
jgi:hypothetical protein